MPDSSPAFGATHIDTAAALPAGQIRIGERICMEDSKGRFVPIESVKPADRLEDELVRKITGHAHDLSSQISRFKQHTLEDFAGFVDLLDQEYGAKRGGAKGNLTFTSFDGCLKVQLQIADRITFGPQLQSAKTLVDECLNEWSDAARPELRAIVNQAFNVDKEGLVNRAEMFRLQRLAIEDERWLRAMDAIRDSIRVAGTKEYVRFHWRPSPKAAWVAIPIDVAAV